MNVTFQIMCHIVHVLVVTHKNVCTKTHPKKYSTTLTTVKLFLCIIKKKKASARNRTTPFWVVAGIANYPQSSKIQILFSKNSAPLCHVTRARLRLWGAQDTYAAAFDGVP